MTSLLTKSALEKLPAEVRDHIIVENETGYSITLSMTIGDFERLVAPHAHIGPLRSALEERERELSAAGELRWEENNRKGRAISLLRQMRDPLFKGNPPTLEQVDAVLALLGATNR